MNTFIDRLSLFRNREYVQNLKELNRALRKVEDDGKYDVDDEENESGKKSFNYTFTQFRDDMSARQVRLKFSLFLFFTLKYLFLNKVHGYSVPKDFQKLYEKSDRYAAMELFAANDHDLKISCGQFLKLIKDNLLVSAKNDKKHK